ncbi:MAG: RNA polymerase sigma factor [Solirubrobacteraceae bacterium]
MELTCVHRSVTVKAVTRRSAHVPRWLNAATRPTRDDRPLLVRARANPALFGEFYADRYEPVLKFFARRVLDPEAAFDLMAETFAQAFEALPKFRGETELEAHGWLWAIARNRLYQWRERGSADRQAIRRLGIELPPLSPAEYDRAEELADFDLIREEIASSFAALPAEQREAVRLRVIEDRSYGEIAEQTGLSEVAVRARVSRGLRRLAHLIDEPVQLRAEEAS